MLASNLKKTNSDIVMLKGSTINAIIDSLKEKPLTQPGYSFSGDRQSATYSAKKTRGYFFFTASVPLIERCIFGINNDGQLYNDPCIVNAININCNSNASPFGLFTNITPYNPTDGYGLCRPIDFYEPVLLFVSDISHIPQIGMPCGPDNDTNNWGISGDSSYGLLCISLPDENGNVWCIRTPDPISIIGIVVDDDIAAYDSTNNQLSEGLIQVQYRNPDANNELINASGPNNVSLQLPIFNSSNNSFSTGTLVKCIAVCGVGLVIIDQSSIIKGRAAANIPHFTAGNVNIYTGIPGAETWDGITTGLAFNHLNEVVRNEWVFLTASGNTATPYYIVSNEYSGKIFGKTVDDFDGNPEASVTVEIYAGAPTAEIDIGEEIEAWPGNFYGAIPAGTWVICNFVAGDVDEIGSWRIVKSIKGNSFTAKVNEGTADVNIGYCPVETPTTVTLYDGINADNNTELEVLAYVKYRPVLENEWVQVEYNGDIFIITKGELDGGFYCAAQQGKINNNSTGTVAMKPITDSSVLVSSLKVDTQEGDVEQGRTVYVLGNRGGFHIVSKSCN